MFLEKFPHYLRLMRLDKPIGILLLLWPTLGALWFAAQGIPDISILIIFICGVILMRSAGCVINDYADRYIDLHIQRTHQRPLTSGKISNKEALLLFFLLILSAFILVLFLNTLTIILSFIALFFATLYPFTKRFTYLPQFFLGIAFSMAIPMAFAAQSNTLPLLAGLLFVANMLWTIAYDTLYAMVDKEDDLKIGVKSTAILFGQWDKGIIAGLQIAFILILVEVGISEHRHIAYYIGLITATGLFIYQHILIYQRQATACFKAFLNNHYAGMVIFIAIVVDYTMT